MFRRAALQLLHQTAPRMHIHVLYKEKGILSLVRLIITPPWNAISSNLRQIRDLECRLALYEDRGRSDLTQSGSNSDIQTPSPRLTRSALLPTDSEGSPAVHSPPANNIARARPQASDISVPLSTRSSQIITCQSVNTSSSPATGVSQQSMSKCAHRVFALTSISDCPSIGFVVQ